MWRCLMFYFGIKPKDPLSGGDEASVFLYLWFLFCTTEIFALVGSGIQAPQ